MAKPKSKASRPTKPGATAAPPPPPPAIPLWPAFKPPLPIVDLSPEPHPLTSKVILIPSFFPRSLCRDYVAFLKTLPLQTTPGRPKRGEAVRVNDRFQVDSPDFARRLWEETGLKDVILDGDIEERWGGEPVGLSPNIRVYRYSKGQFFDCHCRCIVMFLNMHFIPLRTLFDQVPIFNTTLTSDVSPVRRLLHQPVPDVSHGRATVGRAVSGFFSHLPRR